MKGSYSFKLISGGLDYYSFPFLQWSGSCLPPSFGEASKVCLHLLPTDLSSSLNVAPRYLTPSSSVDTQWYSFPPSPYFFFLPFFSLFPVLFFIYVFDFFFLLLLTHTHTHTVYSINRLLLLLLLHTHTHTYTHTHTRTNTFHFPL